LNIAFSAVFKLQLLMSMQALAEWIYPKYLKALKHLGVVDFEDLILKPIEILQNFPDVKRQVHELTRFWMVDEFQDTNDLQMKLYTSIS
jgi:DNA helicase II / ATP-dependent DNA helicase PcrA